MTEKAEKKRRRIVTLQGLTAVVAVAALIVSLISFSNQLNKKASKVEVHLIQLERRRTAEDSCLLFQKVIYSATPKAELPKAVAFLKENGIYDCADYARDVTKVHPNPRR